ncbi:response regulator [Sinirhodobacter populi]|uniref:histidine kinase n=1 Tax=Paenirhodobacter populi TaxID=2306993 RepID=A0A443KAP1_9RHOB|nr:response regulator [Sinirhodobacter populi]RWR29877.1 response regulator [Sinirhodobacter populi]
MTSDLEPRSAVPRLVGGRDSGLSSLHATNRPLEIGLALTAAAIVIGTFVIDVKIPLGRSVWLVYFVPLAMSFLSRKFWLPPAVAVVAIGAMVLGVGLGPDAGIVDPTLAWKNRALGGVVMLALALVGALIIRSRERLTLHSSEQRAQVALSQALQGDPTEAEVGQRALHVLTRLLDARAALAFVPEGEGMRRIATWGVDEEAAATPRGHSHLSRAMNERRVIELRAAAAEAVGWRSGLLRGRAAHSVIVPVFDGARVNGVLEFGLDRPLSPGLLQILDRVGEKIGSTLRSAAYREDLRNLLEETRRQAEELRNQTEELAATNEELEEQASALQQSEARLRDQQAELEEQNVQLESQTRQLEDQRDAIAASRRQLVDQAETLARESRYKSEFVANMSHELRTPLNALLIMARLLAENRAGTLTAEQIRWAQTIESSGHDLLALINDILDLSKIEAGKVELSLAPAAPEAIARKILRGFDALAQERGLALRADIAPGLGEIVTDAGRVEQVLRNFVSNALKFTEKGHVSLLVRTRGEEIVFTVEDTGIGIAPEQQQAVFEAFRQADGTISRRYGGTGLGLSISREMADLLGGRVTLESTPGKGSAFSLILPATRPMVPAAPQPPLPMAEAGLGGVPGVEDDRDRIAAGDRLLLLVEDDPAFARILRDLARETGFRAVAVGTADDAVRAAQKFRPRGIVLDLGLPDHSGLSVLDRLKRDVDTRHIPVHVVSASDHTREALAQGAMSYLLKPVRREALEQAMAGLENRLAGQMRRVLIVEDDPAQLEGLRALLSNDEVETRGAATASEALAACRETEFDCIVLDMTLPDASGFDLLEQLSREEGATFPPVIVYTARMLSEAEEQRLRRYSRSIIIKGAKSPERLIDEVTLFLHQVVSDLPARQREMLAASLNRDAQLDGRRILVVEDDIRNVYALTGIFEPHGAEVQIARNGREALEALARMADGAAPPVDLVLMDVMMPEMDGLTATREIRRIDRWKTLPIIMLTAKAMADDQSQCLAAGANDYLPKPIDVDKLLSLTRVWMAR